MLNKIWFGLLCIGILYGFGKATYQSINMPRGEAAKPQAAATTDEATKADAQIVEPGLTAMGERLNLALIDGAKSAVDICIGLIGIMALWLGMMSIAKDAGMIEAFARLARPLMRWLFPEVPDGHPAQGAMLMNLSANMLGMDNAATPMGLKAMEELQTLNPVKDTATNSMVLFLAINNSSVTIIPFTLIGYRALSGSASPAAPLAGILIVTTFSTVFAVIITKWLSKRRGYQIAAAPAALASTSLAPTASTDASEEVAVEPSIANVLEGISQWMIPATVLLIIVWAAVKRVPLYESFVTGAKEGFQIAVMIIPYLVAMLVVIKVFMASGIFEDIKYGLTIAMQSAGLEAYAETLDLIPLVLTKPLTGSGARAVMLDLFDQHGADSFLGMTASIFMGSTETTFYLLTVYFGAVQIKKFRHTLAACLWTDLAAICAAIVVGYLLYGGR